jgi:tetratricopeptide (TPR) repeat protein
VLVAALLAACGGTPKRTEKPPEKVALPPANPEALREFDAALRALALGDAEIARAKESLRAAVELDERLWEAWHNLGVIEFAEGDDDAATSAFGRALAINPSHRPSLLARAESHRRAGRIGKARRDYERALRLLPEDRDTGARLASLLREAREYEDALDVIRETLRNAGANAKVYVALGHIYMAQGRSELAELVFNKAADLDPKEPSVYNGIALLALEAGDAQRAFERFDHATSLDPDYLAARFNKASVLLDAGDYARAKTELLAVVESSHAEPKALYNGLIALGVAHRGLKEYDLAGAAWERVVKAAPRTSRVRGDALFNLAILKLRFLEDEKAAAAAVDRYLEEAPGSHPKRKAAEQLRKELQL